MNLKVEKEFKNNLAYLMKNKKGYINTIKKHIPESRVGQYESVGFINTGYTFNGNRTYSSTKLAKRYYKDLYGSFDYLKIVFKKFLNDKFFNLEH